MTTYVKGDAVANATSYTLHEKINGSFGEAIATESEINFDVSGLGLEEGDHVLAVKAHASGYTDSEFSNEVTYSVASTSTDEGDDTGDETTDGVDLTSQFTFSSGVLGYEWGWASTSASTSECPSPSSYPGFNANLTYSNFVNIEGYTSLKIVNITRNGSLGGTTGGYAFYTSNDLSSTVTAKAAVNYTSSAPTVQPASFIADGSTSRHHVNAGVEGVVEETITVPDGAKYIRITGWKEGSAYQTIPFSCVGYK